MNITQSILPKELRKSILFIGLSVGQFGKH